MFCWKLSQHTQQIASKMHPWQQQRLFGQLPVPAQYLWPRSINHLGLSFGNERTLGPITTLMFPQGVFLRSVPPCSPPNFLWKKCSNHRHVPCHKIPPKPVCPWSVQGFPPRWKQVQQISLKTLPLLRLGWNPESVSERKSWHVSYLMSLSSHQPYNSLLVLIQNSISSQSGAALFVSYLTLANALIFDSLLVNMLTAMWIQVNAWWRLIRQDEGLMKADSGRMTLSYLVIVRSKRVWIARGPAGTFNRKFKKTWQAWGFWVLGKFIVYHAGESGPWPTRVFCG